MSLYAITLQALAPLFCLILLGYGLKRARVLHASHVPVMNGLVINVTFPALVILGLANAPSLTARAALPPILIILSELLTMVVAYGLGSALKLSRRSMGTLLMVGIYGNTGFLGYPITLALLPHQFPEAILLDQFGMSLPLYTATVLVSSAFSPSGPDASGQRAMFVKMLRSPLLASVFIGLAIRVIPWPHALVAHPVAQAIGHVIVPCLTYLGQATTALILLAFGVALRPGAARKDIKTLALAVPTKLLVSPFMMWECCRLFHVNGDLRTVGILLAGMPSSVMGSVLCGQYDLDGDGAVGIVFITTIFSALTIPLLLSQLR